jgi:hypothetical protein
MLTTHRVQDCSTCYKQCQVINFCFHALIQMNGTWKKVFSLCISILFVNPIPHGYPKGVFLSYLWIPTSLQVNFNIMLFYILLVFVQFFYHLIYLFGKVPSSIHRIFSLQKMKKRSKGNEIQMEAIILYLQGNFLFHLGLLTSVKHYHKFVLLSK